ncbi:hypothetical protein T492DRAFT_114414 [Pavlovales sp. CCMP2436]|nr:hypothetical protein T492DRAFT_114414 [Pavlovales sp. CCMP2436]
MAMAASARSGGNPLSRSTSAERVLLARVGSATLGPPRAPPSRERKLQTNEELLTRERDMMRLKRQHLEEEAKRLDAVVLEMEKHISEYTQATAKLPHARFMKGGNKMKRAELLLSPALAEQEAHRVKKRLESLKDKLQLLSNRHNDMLAKNITLRLRVEEERHVKMHQHSSMTHEF